MSTRWISHIRGNTKNNPFSQQDPNQSIETCHNEVVAQNLGNLSEQEH